MGHLKKERQGSEKVYLNDYNFSGKNKKENANDISFQ